MVDGRHRGRVSDLPEMIRPTWRPPGEPGRGTAPPAEAAVTDVAEQPPGWVPTPARHHQHHSRRPPTAAPERGCGGAGTPWITCSPSLPLRRIPWRVRAVDAVEHPDAARPPSWCLPGSPAKRFAKRGSGTNQPCASSNCSVPRSVPKRGSPGRNRMHLGRTGHALPCTKGVQRRAHDALASALAPSFPAARRERTMPPLCKPSQRRRPVRFRTSATPPRPIARYAALFRPLPHVGKSIILQMPG